jgi:hypothetical protein
MATHNKALEELTPHKIKTSVARLKIYWSIWRENQQHSYKVEALNEENVFLVKKQGLPIRVHYTFEAIDPEAAFP